MPASDLTLEQKRHLVNVWKTAGPALEEIRAKELQEMTEESCAVAIHRALRMADAWLKLNPDFERPCGLVEQQRKFTRCRMLQSQVRS